MTGKKPVLKRQYITWKQEDSRAKGGGSFRQKVRFSEKPEWMNNIFIRKK
jgi:hypothetical protein